MRFELVIGQLIVDTVVALDSVSVAEIELSGRYISGVAADHALSKFVAACRFRQLILEFMLGDILIIVSVYITSATEFLVEQDVGLVTVGVTVVVFYLVYVATVAWYL